MFENSQLVDRYPRYHGIISNFGDNRHPKMFSPGSFSSGERVVVREPAGCMEGDDDGDDDDGDGGDDDDGFQRAGWLYGR